jgi:hypothetical protein
MYDNFHHYYHDNDGIDDDDRYDHDRDDDCLAEYSSD